MFPSSYKSQNSGNRIDVTDLPFPLDTIGTLSTSGVFVTLLEVFGKGILQQVSIETSAGTGTTTTLRVTIDGTVVFLNTTSASVSQVMGIFTNVTKNYNINTPYQLVNSNSISRVAYKQSTGSTVLFPYTDNANASDSAISTSDIYFYKSLKIEAQKIGVNSNFYLIGGRYKP